MNRLNNCDTRRHLSARLPVTVGAAMGLVAGFAIYGATTSATQAMRPVAFAVAKAPVAKAAVAGAPARFANCAAGQKLEKGFCVIHIVRKVVIPPPAASVAAARAPVTGAVAKSPTNPAGVARAGTAARPGSAVEPGSAPQEPGNPAVAGSDGEGATAGSAAPLSRQDAAVLAAKKATALAARDAATLGPNNPATLAANLAAARATEYAASFTAVQGD